MEMKSCKPWDAASKQPWSAAHALFAPIKPYLDRLNILSEWRKTTGKKIGVESDIILPKNWMHHIAERNPKNLE